MSGIALSSADLETLRRKLLYRAWHRGTKEMDLLLGPFADQYVAFFEEGQLENFEQFLEIQDDRLFSWIVHGKKPPHHCAALVKSLRFFHGLTAQTA